MSSAPTSFLSRVARVSGFATVKASNRDAKLLFLQRFVRLFAYGATFIILVHFLSNIGISDERIGLFMTLTLLGDVTISFLLTLITDQVGRRKVLSVGALLMTISGIVFSLSKTYWILVLASVIGVISPSGNEIGPFRAVEESILAHVTEEDDRSDIFVWYTTCGTAGAALGTLTNGWLVQVLQNIPSWNTTNAHRAIFVLYAAIGVIKLVLTIVLSPRVELDNSNSKDQDVVGTETERLLSDDMTARPVSPVEEPPSNEVQSTDAEHAGISASVLSKARSYLPRISRESTVVVIRLIVLFALDSCASGLASPSWLTYFFTTYHGFSPAALSTLFFVTNILATVSNFVALPLARRLGPLKTMVFTHFPSAIFLALVSLAPATTVGSWIAMLFLSLRACTQSMDQAPRQAFISATVKPEERTAILGIVNVSKTLAQAAGLGLAGVFAQRQWWVAMIGGAGVMKAMYDLLILWTFVGIRMER